MNWKRLQKPWVSHSRGCIAGYSYGRVFVNARRDSPVLAEITDALMESFPPSIAYRLPSDFVTVSEDFPAMLFAKSILARFTGKQMWVLYKFKAVSHLNLKFVAGTSSDAGD